MNDKLSIAFPAKITKNGDGYIITFRDLLNVFSEGDTYEETLANGKEVLDILLEDFLFMLEKPSIYGWKFHSKYLVKPSFLEKDEILIAVNEEIYWKIFKILELEEE